MRPLTVFLVLCLTPLTVAQDAQPHPESQPQIADVGASIVMLHIERGTRGERQAVGFVGPGGLVFTSDQPLSEATGVQIAAQDGERFTATGVAAFELMSKAVVLRVDWRGKIPPNLQFADLDVGEVRALATFTDGQRRTIPVDRAEYSQWSWLVEAAVPREERIRSSHVGSPLIDAQGRVMGMLVGPAPRSATARGERSLTWITAARPEHLRAFRGEETTSWDAWPERQRTAHAAWSEARRAQELGSQNEYEECLKHAQAAIEIDPNCWGGWQWLATARNNMDDLDEALEAIERLLELQPTDSWGLSTRAILLASHEFDLKAAEEAARLAVKYSPKDSMSWYSLGFVLQYQGDYEGAMTKYQRAIELDPANSHAKDELGRLRAYQGGEDSDEEYDSKF